MPTSQFSVSNDGPATMIVASGELDLAARDDLRKVLAGLSGDVIVDLERVTFLDSSCIGVLAGAARRIQEQDGEFRLRNPADVPRRTLEITGLEIWIEGSAAS